MNKTQLACLVVAIVTVLLAGVVMQARRHLHLYLMGSGRMIGEELIATTNSTRVVHLGPSLHSRLGDLLSSPAKVEEVRLGDAFEQDGRAQLSVVLGNQHGLRIGLRLRQAEEHDKFHILGHWTVSEGQREPKEPFRIGF